MKVKHVVAILALPIIWVGQLLSRLGYVLVVNSTSLSARAIWWTTPTIKSITALVDNSFRNGTMMKSLHGLTSDLAILVESIVLGGENKPNSVNKSEVKLDNTFAYLYSINSRLGEAPEKVTVVYPFRDRSLSRLELSIKSLMANSKIGFNVIVSDYGSKPELIKELNKLSDKLGFQVVSVPAIGLPWNRSAALNSGILACKSEFVVTTDIDMIFDQDILSECFNFWDEGVVLHCKPLWLNKDGNREDARLGDNNQLGGFLFSKRQYLQAAGFFSESIEYWGLEDIDLEEKLTKSGITSKWLPDGTRLFHIWHPVSYGVADARPKSSWQSSMSVLMKSIAGINSEGDQTAASKAINIGRPILRSLSEEDPYVLEWKGSGAETFKEILVQKDANKFIEVQLSSRFLTHNAKNVELVNTFNDSTKGGLLLDYAKTQDFDDIFLAISVLDKVGLIDYFVSDEMGRVWLLFR